MTILITAIFWFVLVSLALYLYQAGVFVTFSFRAFQFALYILLMFFALTIGIGIQHSSEIYDRPTTTPLSLNDKVLAEP